MDLVFTTVLLVATITIFLSSRELGKIDTLRKISDKIMDSNELSLNEKLALLEILEEEVTKKWKR